MSTYVTLINYTDQGIRNIKDSPRRLANFEKAVRDAGGHLKDFYLVMGEYDLLILIEIPDDAAWARVALATAALGNVRTRSMRAFNRQEFERIVASI